MHILIVTSHPSSKGVTHLIAERYQAASEARGHTTYIMDIYAKEWQQDFLSFEEVKEKWPGAELRTRVQRKISKADELVFVCPMWWGGFPARMKNWIDQNLTSGFAYTYKKGTNGAMQMPLGLLSGRRVRVIMTADGPTWLYKLGKVFFSLPFKKMVVEYCGMKLSSYTIFGDMHKRKKDKKKIEAMLQQAERLVE